MDTDDSFIWVVVVIIVVCSIFSLVVHNQDDPVIPSQVEQMEESLPSKTSNTFQGYECSYDCSGHEAGYDWAEENQVCDTEYDGGNSESFAEGVRAWAEDNC